jgi:uncharacterized protein involved in response to NO
MARISQLDQSVSFAAAGENAVVIACERQKSLMLRAWIGSGLFFMALPGTLLGFSNLMAISAHHGLGTLPAAWMEGHGHAQMFGWIGSFILGIGFYSQPALGRSVLRVPLSCYLFWTSGVAMRWFGNIYGWQWRTLLPISAGFELLAVMLFLYAASHHKLPESSDGNKAKASMELWMISVLIGTTGLAAGVIFNFVECVRLGLQGGLRSFPHSLDQKYLVSLGWGFVVPVVWGFSARWLPSFLAISKPSARWFRVALLMAITGVLFGVSGLPKPATILFALGSITVGAALRLAERTHGHAKTQGIHPSFPVFIRLAYTWLIVAGPMSVWAAFMDIHGGIWGASRHALTVGFAATMVFAIGPRILPHFAGIQRIFSTRLMFFSLVCLQTGCLLRVFSEPLAYEGLASFPWKVLPVSGMLELCGVLSFAANLVLTFLIGRSAFAANNPSQLTVV